MLDSRIGIPRAEHERIFEEFYQVANPQRDARQGHGLGLPTVRRLVGLLGGELQMNSAPGRGSTFRFPVQAGDPARIVSSLGDTVVNSSTTEGRRVLCIDDDPSILEGLSALLGRWGCVVRGVPDEIQALQAVDEGFVPDAVLCDYQLANHRTGAQALSAVRDALRHAGHGEVATLLITGDMASPDLEALSAQGIPVLHKPVTPARLRRTLESLWQQHAAKSGVEAGTTGGESAGAQPPVAIDGQH